MKIYKITLLFLIFFSISFKIYCQDIDLRFNKISVDEGLAHSDVTSIVQDKDGFIWFGTLGGLNRFDGYDLKTFSNQNNPFESVYKNRISKIIPSENYLWLVTQGGIECFNIKTETFLKLNWKLNNNAPLNNIKLNSIYVSSENTIYVLANDYFKVFSIDNSNSNEIILNEQFLPEIPKNANFIDMKVDGNGLEWVISNVGLFFVEKFENKTKLRIINVSTSKESYYGFTGLYTDETNYLLLGTESAFLKANTSIFDVEKE